MRRAPGEQGCLEAAEAFVAADPRPTAILVTDFLHAIALYRRLSDKDLVPGQEISILGLLLESRTHYITPGLTAYHNWTDIGPRLADAVAGEMAAVAAQADGAASIAHHVRAQCLMPAEFSPRESVQSLL